MRLLGGVLISAGFEFASADIAAPAGAQSPDGATDVCSLLTVREVAKTLGQPVREGMPSSRELPRNQGIRDTCTWETQQADTGIREELDLKKVGGNEAFYVFAGEVEVLVDVHFNDFDTNMFGRREFVRGTVDAANRAEKRL